MKGKIIILVFGLIFSGIRVIAQKNFNEYVKLYPIGEDPNIRGMSSYRSEETILFEANPTVRFSVYNNFLKQLGNDSCHAQAWYVSVRPQFRMYTDNSLPVKTPSYRVFFGTQHLFRLGHKDMEERNERFIGFSLESGHYSNGQSGCAFSKAIEDGTAACDSVYGAITPESDLSELLNRESGNFSTNLTELILTYRRYTLDDDSNPGNGHIFNAGIVLYHDRFLGLGNFGGFSDNDINLYGRWRFLAGYEFMHVFKNGAGTRISLKENIELISGAAAQVNPLRNEVTITWYPFKHSRALGFLASYIYGHDNYNFRFVDSGNQGTLGITWSQFPPVRISNRF